MTLVTCKKKNFYYFVLIINVQYINNINAVISINNS